MSQTPAAPQITGKMFLYERPELLNIEQHGGLSVSGVDQPFKFASKVRAVPLTISEMVSASRDYPVVFMSVEDPVPMAIVGLIDDLNLFVDEKGMWEESAYVPGYLRRYPFGVAAEETGERYAVVMDMAFEGLKEGGDNPLFDNGKPTKFTQDAMEFTKNYEEDRRLTLQFIQEVKKTNILTGQTAQYTPQGETEQKSFAQYIGADEQKIKAMPDDEFLAIRKNGILPLLYAQIMSMGNWRTLVGRRARRFGLNDSNLFEPVKLS